MHNAAFQALGINALYSLLDVQPGDIPQTLETLRAQKYGGVNVTIPHKEAAYRFLAAHHSLSDTAQTLVSGRLNAPEAHSLCQRRVYFVH